MAGHSQFKNIMHRKAAQDKKRAKVYLKLTRDIMVAARQGGSGDINSNFALRSAVERARILNMTRDAIERAIKRGTGEIKGDDYTERTYEGYGPGGVAIIVKALTDNPTRTITNLRTAFTRNGGNVGSDGSVAWMFREAGVLVFPLSIGSEEAVMEAAAEAGADNVESTDETWVVTTAPTQFAAVKSALERRLGSPAEAEITYLATQTQGLENPDQLEQLGSLVEALENDDDVQSVITNLA